MTSSQQAIRDKVLEDLWAEFEDVPMNPETECIEAPFRDFPAGTNRWDILEWFDKHYSKGVYALMYDADAAKEDLLQYYANLGTWCCDCESDDCAFNRYGECRFSLVNERAPEITDNAGCLDYIVRRIES